MKPRENCAESVLAFLRAVESANSFVLAEFALAPRSTVLTVLYRLECKGVVSVLRGRPNGKVGRPHTSYKLIAEDFTRAPPRRNRTKAANATVKHAMATQTTFVFNLGKSNEQMAT